MNRETMALHGPHLGEFHRLVIGADAKAVGELNAGEVLGSAANVRDAVSLGYPITMAGTTAVVSIRGTMLPNPSRFWRELGFASTSLIRDAVRVAASDPMVEAIVLDVDSPGGVVSGVDLLSDEVREAAAIKPVVAAVGSMACSAAYWAIAHASEIHAPPTSLVGSIGAYLVLWDTSKLYDQAGIRVLAVTTGYAKAIGVAGVPIDDTQQAVVQSSVDAVFASSDLLSRLVGDSTMQPWRR